MLIKILLISFLTYGQCSVPELFRSSAKVEYTIQDNITNQTLLSVGIFQSVYSKVLVTCYDYESLDRLELRNISQFSTLETMQYIYFLKCFDNQTNHKNYQNFMLAQEIQKINMYFQNQTTDKSLTIGLQPQGKIDGNIFFQNFNFTGYTTIQFENIYFTNSAVFGKLLCTHLSIMNGHKVDLKDFASNSIVNLILDQNEICNLTRSSLAKFSKLRTLEIRNFKLTYLYSFQVPGLFDHNYLMEHLVIDRVNDNVSLSLHENVFRKLKQLKYLSLSNLNLLEIPKGLFYNLPELNMILLHGNAIKIFNPDTFITNLKLNTVLFGGSFFNSDTSFDFNLPSNEVTIGFTNEVSYINNYNVLTSLLNNPNINKLSLHNVNMTNISLSDFDAIKNRPTPIKVEIALSNQFLKISDLITHNVSFAMHPSLTYDEKKELNAFISVSMLGDTEACRTCQYISNMFPFYIDGKFNDKLEVYLNVSKVLVEFIYLCTGFELHYFNTFTDNCPAICECQHIPLLDKITIDCSERGLTSMPDISYPVQIHLINSIDLNLSNNLLSNVTFTQLDDQVLGALSNINLRNNTITSFSMPSLLHPHQLDLCFNEFLKNISTPIGITLDGNLYQFTELFCLYGKPYPNPNKYIIENKIKDEIQSVLDDIGCKP